MYRDNSKNIITFHNVWSFSQAFPIADRAREGGGRGLAVGRDRRVGEKKRLVAGAALIPEQHSKCQKKVTIFYFKSFNLLRLGYQASISIPVQLRYSISVKVYRHNPVQSEVWDEYRAKIFGSHFLLYYKILEK